MRIKASPEDFIVEEIPAYEPCGEGEHLYVRFTKRGLTTDEAASWILVATLQPATPETAACAMRADQGDARAATFTATWGGQIRKIVARAALNQKRARETISVEFGGFRVARDGARSHRQSCKGRCTARENNATHDDARAKAVRFTQAKGEESLCIRRAANCPPPRRVLASPHCASLIAARRC